jgi:hypothetical protein
MHPRPAGARSRGGHDQVAVAASESQWRGYGSAHGLGAVPVTLCPATAGAQAPAPSSPTSFFPPSLSLPLPPFLPLPLPPFLLALYLPPFLLSLYLSLQSPAHGARTSAPSTRRRPPLLRCQCRRFRRPATALARRRGGRRMRPRRRCTRPRRPVAGTLAAECATPRRTRAASAAAPESATAGHIEMKEKVALKCIDRA